MNRRRTTGLETLVSALARHRRVTVALLITLWLLPGCSGTGGDDPEPDGRPALAGIQLRLLVVDDPQLVIAIRKVQGEWTARTGAELSISETTSAELAAAAQFDADAVIYPSNLLGTLAARGWLAPLPSELQGSSALDWPDVLETLRTRQATWGNDVVALPCGSPVLVCYYRSDLLEQLGRKPPQTWVEYAELAALLSDREKLGDAAPPDDAPWEATAEPLGKGFAAYVLLARAAAYAQHPDYFSTLFDVQSMDPLITGPAFQRALEELQASGGGPNDLDPLAARDAVFQNRCAMALGWATRADTTRGEPEDADVAVGVAPLPGAEVVYDPKAKQFVPRELTRVPLLCGAGRVASVNRKCEHQAGAFQLLVSLMDEEWGARVFSASGATTLFRSSQAAAPRAWTPGSAEHAAEYAAAVANSLSGRQVLYAMRIPGHAEYVTTLDEAVRAAVAGDQTPAAALQQAADRWQQITDRLGREKQREAYRASVVRVN